MKLLFLALISFASLCFSGPRTPQDHFLNACEEGNREEIRGILGAAPVNINGTDPAGEPLLHKVSRMADPTVMQLFLGRGADVNLLDSNKYSALHVACFHGSIGVAKVLIEARAEINSKSDNKRYPPSGGLQHLRPQFGAHKSIDRARGRPGCCN